MFTSHLLVQQKNYPDILLKKIKNLNIMKKVS